ncbi:hypothetical protein J2T56_001222 [Natronobacillus azotifigens]|uniref:DUF3048 domain-containing protein n=1 Tax=Natronobacillus azotifigens TaxID=472978 RepID=A0A9J6RBH4_9BACI|nr:DUF3048 domain-containing protein [Natronobacillus azotifigens]MCZ0702885.1 DUF3048 domain-containing protein [Natronobacillus azotifigens]
MKKVYFLGIILLLLFIGIIGCSDDEEVESGNDLATKEVEKEPIETPEPSEPANMYPLTGIRTDEEVNNRIVSVMINNHPNARPQSGLSQADIVFEILSEGNTTRFLALFHSESPDVVGPVRSAREYYFDTAENYGALYIYHGAAGFIEDMLRRSDAVDNLNAAYYDNDGHLFKRESFRVAPHNSYLQFGAVEEVATSRGYQMERAYDPLPFLSEDESNDITGEEVSEVSFNYGSDNVRYVYDNTEEAYFRYNGQEQTKELNTETPIQLDNVFIIETAHRVIDDQGRRDVDLTSGGNAYLLQKGKVQKIQWESRDGRIIPVRGGEAVGFVPGKTWINVIPTSPGLSEVTESE